MAAFVEKWFCDELSKLGLDVSEENAQYILSMEDAEDLQEYMLNLLDGSDPAVQAFLPRLMDRWCALGGRPPPNVTVYKKVEQPQVYVQPKSKKKRGKNKTSASQASVLTADSVNGSNVSPAQQTVNGDWTSVNGPATTQPEQTKPVQNGEVVRDSPVGQGARKKSKFVPLYSQQGKEKLVIKLPGRTQCECQALKHKLVNNCLSCGRVVCEQEGAGPCLFCGHLVATVEDQEVLDRGSKKSEKLRQSLMRDADKFTPLCRGGGEREVLPSVSARMQEGLEKAVKQKDRLLEFDKTSARRTQVIDDQCDYYATDTNRWLNKNEREALRKREEELRSARFASRKDRKVTLDFAGRQVVEEANTVGRTMYDHRDAVVQEVQYGRAREAGRGDNKGEMGYLVNPTIVQPAPQFVPDPKSKTAAGRSTKSTSDMGKSKGGVIQDRELREMTDEGQCLSMHQPWASLLVAGIKIHEGRTWYTAHRGRLWIASTAQTASPEEISELERHYQFQYEGEVDFPTDYPSGCLLGCVDLVDCQSQEDYRQKFPDGESASPYVFICENPQQLLIKFPIKGKHKIYKLDSTIHQAAKKGLR
ncbi:activating signal cointegrator 1-like isoform X2 [Babylonia areolata]|uniref:activating signal cointegrator 1-like isoform X2 n=1 Tax=Babylonia areolata TaxID=304850 RepID=UPI003FD285FA